MQPRRRDFTRSSQGIPNWGQGIPDWAQGIPNWGQGIPDRGQGILDLGQCRQPLAALPLHADTSIPAHSVFPPPPACTQHQQQGQADTTHNGMAQLGMAFSADTPTGRTAANACQQGAQQRVCFQRQRGDDLRQISEMQAAHSRLYHCKGQVQQPQQQDQQQQNTALGQFVPRTGAPVQCVADVPVQQRLQPVACSSDAQQQRHRERHQSAALSTQQPACSQGRSQRASPANTQEHVLGRQGAEQSVVLEHPQQRQPSAFHQAPYMDLYRTESVSAKAAQPSAMQTSSGTSRPATAPLRMQHNRPSTAQRGPDSWQGHGGCSKQTGVTDLAAMEAVLDDYKGLRAQIAEAEHQLADLQAAVMQPHIASDVVQPDSGHAGSVFPQGVHEHAQLLAATQRLERLKGAAAFQRPAVEAVALQLRNTLLRS